MATRMVFWMRKYRKLLLDIVIILAFTMLLMFPYLTKSFLAIEHDTFFHVSRIEQYARALQHGRCFPLSILMKMEDLVMEAHSFTPIYSYCYQQFYITWDQFWLIAISLLYFLQVSFLALQCTCLQVSLLRGHHSITCSHCISLQQLSHHRYLCTWCTW